MTAKLNINTIRQRATAFAKEFSKATYEMGQAQNFIRELCHVFGLDYRRAVRFEERVNKLGGKKGRIDGFFPGKLLVEMKSAGEDMDKAFDQATKYTHGLKDEEMPDYVLVCDFANLHLHNRVTKEPPFKVKLADFPQHIEPFLFMAEYEAVAIREEQQANELAAEKMAGLHDAIKATGYQGKDLETYLVRLLFCLFADDTALFDRKGVFLDYLINHTKVDGSDLHGALTALFDTLNRPRDKRHKNIPEHLDQFPYVNGALFQDSLAQCYFDEAARGTLVECAQLDWSQISPAIFGSLFQAIMHFDGEASTAKTKKRREFGAHYTSETNILKAIKPLFLDGLRDELKTLRRNSKKLKDFHQRLSTLNFFDPACGCGNFLVIAYRELRLLELEVIEALWGKDLTGQMDVDTLILCNVNQFHGIEIDPSAAQIAKVALWLTDHQMNLEVQRFGNYYRRLPLEKQGNIVCGNALQIDWASVLPPEQCSYLMGNPPFVGYSYQSKEQKADLERVFKDMKGSGVLDYVCAWYVKAADYIQANPTVPVAFVSTNSICQGEQVTLLWGYLLAKGIIIQFAHRTFRWSNEGRGVAAVHCVIIGFGLQEPKQRMIYDYGDDITGEPIGKSASNINPYLVDAPAVLIEKRRKPICQGVPEMTYGSKPTDGGHLLLTFEEVKFIQENDPVAKKYIKPFLNADEFINNVPRYCLWLPDSTAQDRKNSQEIQRRIKLVKNMREDSTKLSTKRLADIPYLFGEIRQKNTDYIVIPLHSSENRAFVPIGYFDSDTICGNGNSMLPDATPYHFGILSSTFHNAWMRTVCGRLKSDYRYSNTIVYNNFPWPESPSGKQTADIEKAAQSILDARKAEEKRCADQGQACSLAILYAPGNLPADLLKAHQVLDKAVDAAYGYKGGKDDAARVAFLFGLYQQLVDAQKPTLADESTPPAPSPTAAPPKRTRKPKT